MHRTLSVCAYLAILSVAVAGQQTAAQNPRQGNRQQQPTRDNAQQREAQPVATGRIMGRVVAADNGRPVKRARVFVSAPELPGGRGILTDDSGAFDLTELPAGRYTLTVSKTGFVALAYGQRRPLQAGTPLQLLEGQQLKGVDFSLPRGGVIAGRVIDEDGEPVAGAMVRVMRYQYQQGERRLTPAGAGQTDDRGQYRVWGLMPGDYYVNALTRMPMPGGRGEMGGRGGPGGPGGGGRGGRGGPLGGAAAADPAIAELLAARLGGNAAAFFGGDEQEAMNYAPTYFPAATSAEEARAITVGVSQEVQDINIAMQLVRTARITGRITNPDGSAASNGNVNLMAEGAAGRGPALGGNFGGRIQRDGAFTVSNVPPGRYILRARGEDSDPPLFAAQPLSVNGVDLNDVTVALSPGATLTGTVSFLPGGSPAPDLGQVRIGAPSTDAIGLGPQPVARVDREGRFSLSGVPAGLHLIRPSGGMRGWVLKSVTLDGRDITDTPFEVRSGQAMANFAITFTDKVSEITGTVNDTQGTPVPDYTILAFPTNASLWRPQARQIMTTRPDQTGKFRIRGLPPGEYYLATVDPAEQGEWFDPTYLDKQRAGAVRITLGDGDAKTQDFTVRR